MSIRSFVRGECTNSAQRWDAMPLDDVGVAWLCSVPGCQARGRVHDPGVGRPLCAAHFREWQAQLAGWQS